MPREPFVLVLVRGVAGDRCQSQGICIRTGTDSFLFDKIQVSI